jgi:hypothetical protein
VNRHASFPFPKRVAIALILFFILLASCGGLTEFDDTSPAGICERGGGDWRGDGCNGSGDHCGKVACETALGDGCQCDMPNYCWDGNQCVLDKT